MTKAQGHTSPAPRLTATDVIRAALDVLNDHGLEGVSTRAVAKQLGVRMNTVLWHVKTKAHLLELMSDAIIGQVTTDALQGVGRERASELMHRLRRVLLEHRDGALLVSRKFVKKPHTLGIADRLLAILLEESPSSREAVWTVWSLFYFTLGLVREEQTTPAEIDAHIANSVSSGAYPSLSSVVDELASADFDDRFEYGLSAILSSLGSSTASLESRSRQRRAT